MRMKALLSTLCLGLCALSVRAQDDPVLITVERMTDQPLPLSVTSARLQSFQYTSELSAQLSSDRDVRVAKADLVLVVFRDGKVISGEGWQEEVPGGLILHRTQLAIHPGDQAVLLVESVTTDSRTFRLNAHEMTEGIQAQIQGKAPTHYEVEVSLPVSSAGSPKLIRTRSGPDSSYCDQSNSVAVASCNGQGGIGSFSCDDTRHSSSHSCKGLGKGSGKPTQGGPGSN